MNICIFEDLFISQLAPVNYLRHTSELICGTGTLLDKIQRYIPAKTPLTLHSRKYISGYLTEKFPKALINKLTGGEYIFLNSRLLLKQVELKEIIKYFKKENNTAIINGNAVAAFHLTADKAEMYREVINSDDDNPVSGADIEWLNLKKTESSSYRLINYPSDLILFNGEMLDYELAMAIKGRKKIHKGKKCSIAKNAVFDTTDGRIFIDDGTVIEPFTYIKGPVYIGKNSTIRSGAQIYGPVSAGSSCKVSGEITSSILHSYVNKQHYGFLGHSYLCEWVNLGAGTTTSNLKNNYSKIILNIDDRKVDTNSIFLGSIIGDHTKTGIQTMLNTGTIVGISSNLYGAGYHNKKIRSYSWEDASNNEVITYEIEKAISTAGISLSRRNVNMSEAYDKMMRYVFDKKDENLI